MKILEHPNLRLIRKIEEQERLIRNLQIDMGMLRELLTRTIKIIAKNDIKAMVIPKKEDKNKI